MPWFTKQIDSNGKNNDAFLDIVSCILTSIFIQSRVLMQNNNLNGNLYNSLSTSSNSLSTFCVAIYPMKYILRWS